MFIEPTIMKAVRVPTEYTLTEAPVENLKTYVFSNVQKFGKGPEAWRSTTNLSKHELFGANVQAEIARLKENEVKPNFP